METSASNYDQEACIRVAFPLTSGIMGFPYHHYYLAKIKTETNKNGQSKQHYHYLLIV